MFFGKRKQNEYERNSKEYIKGKFEFLIDRGYRFKYYHKNGEELFRYSTDVRAIEIINEPNYIDVIVRYGNEFPYDHEHNIREIISSEISNDIKMLAPIQIIDYFAMIVSKNIDKIERFH